MPPFHQVLPFLIKLDHVFITFEQFTIKKKSDKIPSSKGVFQSIAEELFLVNKKGRKMEKKKSTASKKRKKKSRVEPSSLLCWILIPAATVLLLVLDGLGFYQFNTQRLLVLGACALIMLIPFFSEITVKSITLRKDEAKTKEKKS